MEQLLRVGIVGANASRGWAKDAHIPALNSIPGVVISAVSARDSVSARAAADAFQTADSTPIAFGDSLELTRSPEVDIVSVTVKVPEHKAIVMSALKAGKHVYCEWPLGRNIAEATEMAATARDAGSHVIIGLQGIMSPAVRRAVEIIDQGILGSLLSMRVFSPTAGWAATAPSFYRYLNDRSTGATLSTITGGHTLALIGFLVDEFREVDARASILRPNVTLAETGESFERTCADHLVVISKHKSGCICSLEVAGGQSIETPFRLELTGSRGNLTLTSNHPGGFQVGNMGLIVNGEEVQDLKPTINNLQGPPANVAENYIRLIQDIREDTFTVPDFEDAVNLTGLLDAIERASDTGKREYL